MKLPSELVVGGLQPTDQNMNDISNVLDKIKIIIHRPDIPISILIEYLFLNFACFM